jgi:glycosyltransferase involved in cell wall biosynthesis
MAAISVVICTHNPRRDYLRRALDALQAQTLARDRWELLIVDNASTEPVADTYDLSWHPRARHVGEERIGLTLARLRGIEETAGELLVFADDDNVLAPDFLVEAWNIHGRYPFLGAFGAGVILPDFEVQPPAELRPRLSMLALRNVQSARWSNTLPNDDSIPWGAGLCVTREVAASYPSFVQRLAIAAVLDRRGHALFSGGDDVFSWTAASAGYGFGIFPQLRITHLIAATRLRRRYFLRLIHDHAFSGGVLRFALAGVRPRAIDSLRYVRVLLHGARNGPFSMRCYWAAVRGEDSAARFIAEKRLKPLVMSGEV